MYPSDEDFSPKPKYGTVLGGLLIASIGWIGLFYMLRFVLPGAGARWAFFVLLYMAIAGSSIPFLKLLNRRFSGRRFAPPPDWVSLRQSLWLGLYVCICAWLQIPRVLNGTLAFFLALSVIVIEIFLRLRERALYGF